MNRIKEVRKEKGYSQKSLADALNVNQTAVSQWERGATLPASSTLAKLSKLLDSSSDYLLGLSENKDPHSWSNDELIKVLTENQKGIIKNLLESASASGSEVQHSIFSILIEIQNILNSVSSDPIKDETEQFEKNKRILIILDSIASQLNGIANKEKSI